MKHKAIILTGLLTLLLATSVAAGPGDNDDKGDKGKDSYAAAHCPPGLAKKNPPCVPPEQAGPGMIIGQGPLAVGDHLPAGNQIVIDPSQRIGLDDALYVREGDSLYRFDRRTGLVLDLIGAVDDLLR